MTQHILCAVDLTHLDDAKGLLKEADGLATHYGAVLSVVTVLPDYGSSWVGTFFDQNALSGAAEAAIETLHELTRETIPDRAEIQHIVEVGSVYEKTLLAIEESHADLVILGAHKPELTERILGPNAARIVRHSPVSTLVVRL